MKRSEMVKLLAGLIKNTTEPTAERQAHYFLRCLEAEGMLPPFLPNRDIHCHYIEEDCNWEPEDD